MPVFTTPFVHSATDLSSQLDLRVEVALGMPKHDCKFHGICKINLHQAAAGVITGCRREDNLLRDGMLHINLDRGQAALVIRIGQLAPELEQYHFARERLRVWEPLPVADYLPASLNDDRYILPGAYQLIRSNTHYTVRFRLGQMNLPLTGLIWNTK